MHPSTGLLQLYVLCSLVVFHATHGTSDADSDLLKAAAEAAWTEGELSEEAVVKQTSTKRHKPDRKASDEVSLAMSATKQLVQEVSNQGYIPVQQSQKIACDKEGFCDCNGDCGSDLCACKEALACCGDGGTPNLGGLTAAELQALHSDAKRQRVLDTSWRELGPNLQAAARILGYNAPSWDLNKGVAAEGVSWGRLTGQQRKAAIALGYSEQTWFETLKKKDLSFLHRLERGGVWKLDKKDAKFLEDLELNKNIAHLTSKDVDYLHQQEKESQALERVEVAFLDELKRDAPWLIWGSAAMCATGFVISMILLLQHANACPSSLKTLRREEYEAQL